MICVDPAKRITIWELLNDKWLQRGFGAPIEWASKTEVFNYKLLILII